MSPSAYKPAVQTHAGLYSGFTPSVAAIDEPCPKTFSDAQKAASNVLSGAPSSSSRAGRASTHYTTRDYNSLGKDVTWPTARSSGGFRTCGNLGGDPYVRTGGAIGGGAIAQTGGRLGSNTVSKTGGSLGEAMGFETAGQRSQALDTADIFDILRRLPPHAVDDVCNILKQRLPAGFVDELFDRLGLRPQANVWTML